MSIIKNDTVWILSTARKISHKEVEPAVNLIKDWGLNVCIGKSIDAEENQFAGIDGLRAQDLQEAINDSRTKAIWCARGGYGTVRIIDKVDFLNYLKNPVPIIGYSDVTVLHSHLHILGVQSIHATMPVNLNTNTPESIQSLKDILFGCKPVYKIAPSEKNRAGNATGKIVGGNLSILYSLLGSGSAIKTSGKILFIEDIDEYLYHIDRMLMNLKRNNYFDELRGLIVGSFTKMNDNTIPFGKTAEEIILDITSEFDFPVIFNFPAGHINDNRALILGSKVEMNVDDQEAVVQFL